MNGLLKGMGGALALALAMWTAGCSGSTCDSTSCPSGQTCNTTSGKCEAPVSKCGTCPTGFGCDESTATCKNLCTGVANPPKCTLPQTCNPVTGKCEDLCANQAPCASASQTCNPATGSCVEKCSLATCSSTQTCEATTGKCTDKCETATKPAGQAECTNGQVCSPTKGVCEPPCTEKTCGTGQWCDNSSGQCKSGPPPAGYPGTACSSASDCNVPGSAQGEQFSCLTSIPLQNGDSLVFPGGYCSADCSAANACPQGSYCLQGLGCLQECTKDSDCRNTPQYRCQPLGDTHYACLPAGQCGKTDPSQCGGVGADCASDADCISGASCFTENYTDTSGNTQFSGFDNGYCGWVAHSGDTCPPNSTAVPVDPNDPNLDYCLRSCTIMDPTGCNLGEACLQISQNDTTHGVCYAGNCSADVDCQKAACTAQDKNACGKNQPCSGGTCSTADYCTQDTDCCLDQNCTKHGTCDTTKHECMQSFCEPTVQLCLPDCTAFAAFSDTDGACQGVTCDVGQVCDKSQGGKCVNAVCPDGTTCNATTKRCDRGCKNDSNCGASGVCENSVCVAVCTKHNEAEVCTGGTVCNYASGRCQAKCTDDASCGEGAYCDTASGHCQQRCDSSTNPTQCTTDQYCDTTSGKCQTKCTARNETTVCAQDKYCQTSTGLCLPNCKDNPSECGTDKCNVSSTGEGTCGLQCNSDAACGSDPSGAQLHCTAASGSTVKRCQ